MAELIFNIQGIENVIDQLKKTRVVSCGHEGCINNSANPGRSPRCLSGYCLLPEVRMDKNGRCDSRPMNPKAGLAYKLLRRIQIEAQPVSTDLWRIEGDLMQRILDYFISR